MTAEEFNDIVRDTLNKSSRILCMKGNEYAGPVDRLANFKLAAGVMGCSLQTALTGMMVKHTVSLYMMLGEATNKHGMELWDEKILDHINYLILLRAVLKEQEQSVGG
jgi:hypothetical protein